MTGRLTSLYLTRGQCRRILLWLIFCCSCCNTALNVWGTESVAPPSTPAGDNPPHFYVRGYTVEGGVLLSTNILGPLFFKYTGTNVSLQEIVKAASDLQSAYRDQGYPTMSVAFVPGEISDGIVTFNVAQTAIPQIVIAGERCLSFSNGLEIVSQPTAAGPKPAGALAAAAAAPATSTLPPVKRIPTSRASQEEIVAAMAALQSKMNELEVQAKDTRVHVVSTNTGPRFEVEKYLVDGNTVLPLATLGLAITNIDGAFGTNVGFDGIETVVTELGKAYHERGYVTVTVNVPQQKLTNATVKLQVLEGRLGEIKVVGNHYYSSNNVMRALPSLHTNMVLNGPIFNDELNRANANQNRQIYPVIGPGPESGTSELTLNVKDRLPLHAKAEFDNENSPGTPPLRVNTSAVYDNLWQAEHSLGVQYGFSPGQYKQGDQWNFYDLPAVAYYSTYYRLPLGNPERIENTVANNPGNFGYDEATRQFNLPPPTGQANLTLYASRATIDTGLENLGDSTIFAAPNNIFTITREDVQQDITINEDAGFRLTKPLAEIDGVNSLLAGGLDLKKYSEDSYLTNSFITSEVTFDQFGNPLPPLITTVPSPITTLSSLNYLPMELDYNANLQDAFGPATWGLGLIGNLWYASAYSTATGTASFPPLNGVKGLQAMTGSTEATGHWVILRPSFTQNVSFYTNWITSLRTDGQWASQPLISPEQFGAGGVNSVRGYHEGEVFGDTGYHVSLEQQTPGYVVGTVYDGASLTVRGSVYMDYACVYLIDPRGRQQSTPLWGTGFGVTAAVGSHWQTQLLFSWPLLSAGTTTAYQPRFNFSLTGQF